MFNFTTKNILVATTFVGIFSSMVAASPALLAGTVFALIVYQFVVVPAILLSCAVAAPAKGSQLEVTNPIVRALLLAMPFSLIAWPCLIIWAMMYFSGETPV